MYMDLLCVHLISGTEGLNKVNAHKCKGRDIFASTGRISQNTIARIEVATWHLNTKSVGNPIIKTILGL